MPDEKKYNSRVATYIPPKLYYFIEEERKLVFMSQSAFIKKALEYYLHMREKGLVSPFHLYQFP